MGGFGAATCLPFIYQKSNRSGPRSTSIIISTRKTFMQRNETLDAALEYLENGWAVIPIDPAGKKPLIKWGEYVDQSFFPSEDDLIGWWTKWPDANVAVLTGPLSGIVVVDCDSESARDAAKEAGLTRTPYVVKTKKGWHYYFKFPRGGDWIKNRTGVTGDGVEWPSVDGLDLRGSKGYALLPPSKGYAWKLMQGSDWDDVPVYSPPTVAQTENNVVNFNQFKFEGMSLEGVSAHQSIWESTAEIVSQQGKLPDGGGNARDDRLWKCIAEGAAQGLRGQDLIDNAFKFMEEFYADMIDSKKVAQMCSRVEGMEEKNHPDRLEVKADPEDEDEIKGITTADIPRLKEEAGSVQYYVEPFIPTTGTIIQVHGYSGHGKSMFTRHLLYAAAAGQSRFGPFELIRRPRVLYFDFENSRSNVQKFLARSMSSFGDAGDNFVVFAPFDNAAEINLRTDEGLKLFQKWIVKTRPDIIVIDTVRSAWPGLEENSAEQWSKINQLCLRLRNRGITVILVHHSNKPSEGNVSGREAGSSNQLTVLETQIKITQVFNDKATAQAKAGLFDGDLINTPMERLSSPQALKDGERLEVCTELRYGKVREYTDMHEPVMYVGYAGHDETEDVRVVSSLTAKQRAIRYASQWADGMGHTRAPLSDREIADKVMRPVSVVREWTLPIRAIDHGSRIAELG